jgi:hypothetical protein
VELRGSMVVSEGKRPLLIPRCRWEDNFKMEPPIENSRPELIWLRMQTDDCLFLTRKVKGSIQWGEFLDETTSYQLLNTLSYTFGLLVIYCCNMMQNFHTEFKLNIFRHKHSGL